MDIRFTQNGTTATNVAFKGGAGNDYVEFELGNVSATGGAGTDTFAFITTASGVTNSTYGSGDTITGGAGSDTLQLGLNGSGTYTLSTTEFANTTGVDVLDLRGATNTVTLSSAVVAAADAGTFTVRTDRIVQTSTTDSANASGTGSQEDASTNTINITQLNAGQGISIVGGSGSDRIVGNNATINAATIIDAGTNAGTAGRYDTLTVVNSAVLDRTDLANIKGLEGLILVENVTGNSQFNIELTSDFLLNNTQASNSTSTSIDDTVFQIGTVGAADGTALNTGDTVTIDISGLLNATRTGLASSITGRGIDVSSLTARNVTVTYVVDGATATTAQRDLVLKADASGQAGLLSSAANAAAVAAPTFTGTEAADTYTLAANSDVVTMLGGNDTLTVNGTTTAAPTGSLDGGAGTADRLVVAGAGVNFSGATLAGFEQFDNGGMAVTLTAAQLNGFTTGIAGAGAITINDSAAAADTSFSTSTTYELANGGSFTGNAAVTYAITEASGTATNETVTIAAGWAMTDSVDLGAGTADKFVLSYDVAGAIDLATTAGSLVNVEQFQSTVNQSNGNITFDTGLNTVNLSAQTTATTLTATGVTFNSLTLGSANDTINVLTTGATAATIDMGAGTDTITSLVTGAGAVSLTFGAGNDTITNITTHGAGVLTTKFGAPAGTQTLTVAATTANFSLNDVFDFATNVTAIVNAVANGTNGVAGQAGQIFVDTTTSVGNTIITFDADGNRLFSAGDVQITIMANVVGLGIDASGNALVTASA